MRYDSVTTGNEFDSRAYVVGLGAARLRARGLTE